MAAAWRSSHWTGRQVGGIVVLAEGLGVTTPIRGRFASSFHPLRRRFQCQGKRGSAV